MQNNGIEVLLLVVMIRNMVNPLQEGIYCRTCSTLSHTHPRTHPQRHMWPEIGWTIFQRGLQLKLPPVPWYWNVITVRNRVCLPPQWRMRRRRPLMSIWCVFLQYWHSNYWEPLKTTSNTWVLNSSITARPPFLFSAAPETLGSLEYLAPLKSWVPKTPLTVPCVSYC